MAIHIYMSTTRGERQPDGSVRVPGDAIMAYRGEAGPGDDAHGFKRRQEGLGYVVVLKAKPCAKQAPPRRREGSPQQGPRCTYRELMEG